MKTSLFISVIIAVLCLSLTSCVTCKQSGINNVPFSCIVQSEAEVVIYEIHLDGKLVSSNKTMPSEKGMQAVKLVAAPGDHVLTVTAPGYETWQKTITVMSSTACFWVELKKPVK